MTSPAALVTGGTSGIGLATARLLLRRGHGVVATGHDPASIDETTHDDVAEVVAFLASDGAGYVTGQNVVVGGGIEV